MSDILIALDGMGGDYSPKSVISGAEFALKNLLPKNCDVRFNIYGREREIFPVLKKYRSVMRCSDIVDADEVVLANDKPSFALRQRKSSSMYCAIEAIKRGEVAGVVSSGNTGALMAISRMILGTLSDILRPAIVAAFPSKIEDFVMLDLGANIECNSDLLFQFAIMGNAFAKTVLNIENPRVALLNVGSEEVKGTESIRKTYSLLKNININFCGYVEANEVLAGNIDVVVTDGFSGNVLLKASESMSVTMLSVFKDTISSSFITQLAGLLVRSKLRDNLKRFDPKTRNGAMLLGLNGVVVKSHGNSDDISFAHAIRVAVNAIRNDINKKIVSQLSNI